MVNPLPQDVTDDQSLPGSGAKKRRVEKNPKGEGYENQNLSA